MDNVTHTLAGLLLAEGALQLGRARTRREPSGRLRTVAAVVGAVGANLPDIDVLYTTLSGDRLTYLLHHRGYTHTVVVALVGAVGLWALGRWALRRRAAGAADLADGDGRLLALALVAVASHLALDWTNNYGVHPFWPVSNRWHYGDAVFIIEPWLWAVAVPTLLLATRRRAGQVALVLVLVAAIGLAWGVPLVARGAAAAVTLGAIAAFLLTRRLRPAVRPALAIAAWLTVELTFVAGTRAARARFATLGARDVVITPGPSNPLCAGALVVERAGVGAGARYRLTTASVAALPAVVPVERCAAPSGGATLGMRPAARPALAGVAWGESWEAPLAELATLARGSCQAAAALRFMRVPFWVPRGADSVVVGDLRYDRSPGDDFAELTVARRPATCPTGVPPWEPPVARLLAE